LFVKNGLISRQKKENHAKEHSRVVDTKGLLSRNMTAVNREGVDPTRNMTTLKRLEEEMEKEGQHGH
jgi:hypothetical protein